MDRTFPWSYLCGHEANGIRHIMEAFQHQMALLMCPCAPLRFRGGRVALPYRIGRMGVSFAK